MVAVMIGIDPHKRSNTALVLDGRETVLARRRFANDSAGYRDLKAFARGWKQRTWAVEGARGVGLSLAQRLAIEGEHVLDVPAVLSARVRPWVVAAAARPTRPTRTPLRSPACGVTASRW